VKRRTEAILPQDVDLARLRALIERYGPEAIIEVATEAKASLPSLSKRKFEQFKIDVDFLLPSLLGPDDRLEEPPYQTIVAAVTKLRPYVGEDRHLQLAKKYQRYRRSAGAKRGIRTSISVPLG